MSDATAVDAEKKTPKKAYFLVSQLRFGGMLFVLECYINNYYKLCVIGIHCILCVILVHGVVRVVKLNDHA